LVALDAPDFQNATVTVEKIKLFSSVEDGATIRSVVALDVETWRVGFWKEEAGVALRGQGAAQKIKMVHLLTIQKSKSAFSSKSGILKSNINIY